MGVFTGGPVVNPTPCPTGFYCPSGTSAAQSFPCPAGTFGPDQYYVAVENCTDCPAGSYCERDGLDTTTGECWAGFYCTGGASSPTPFSHNVSADQGCLCVCVCVSCFSCDGTSHATTKQIAGHPHRGMLGRFQPWVQIKAVRACVSCFNRDGTSHATTYSAIGTPVADIKKLAVKGYSHSFRITCKMSAVSLLKSREWCCIKVINKNNVWVSWWFVNCFVLVLLSNLLNCTTQGQISWY